MKNITLQKFKSAIKDYQQSKSATKLAKVMSMYNILTFAHNRNQQKLDSLANSIL